MKYKDWIKSLADDTLKRTLKTADRVLADADNTYLDSSDLSKLHDCWEVIDISRKIIMDSEVEIEKENNNYDNNNYNN